MKARVGDKVSAMMKDFLLFLSRVDGCAKVDEETKARRSGFDAGFDERERKK